MNKEQADVLKRNTCYLIEVIEPVLKNMAEHGMPQKEIDQVDNAIDMLYKLNKKYVRKSK